jgi:hypothetical protein
MCLLILFMMCVKESRKVILIDSNGTVNETTLNDTINEFTNNYNSFMRLHKNILIMLNNLYYAIHK